MELNSWPGLIAVILAVISFYGTTYLVIALNTGWRFGYWLTSACFGALMVLLSIFWTINVRTDQAVGPQGELPRWVAVAAAPELERAEFQGEPLSAPARYPTGDWEKPEAGDEQIDAFTSAVGNCLTANPESLPADEQKPCEEAQKLMPDEREVPVLEGTAVAVQTKVVDLRFAEDNGSLAQAIIRPVTTDPRISKDPDGELLAEPFEFVAILEKGSVGFPSYMSLVVFVIYTAIHLWGLNRAEKRKLQPAVV